MLPAGAVDGDLRSWRRPTRRYGGTRSRGFCWRRRCSTSWPGYVRPRLPRPRRPGSSPRRATCRRAGRRPKRRVTSRRRGLNRRCVRSRRRRQPSGAGSAAAAVGGRVAEPATLSGDEPLTVAAVAARMDAFRQRIRRVAAVGGAPGAGLAGPVEGETVVLGFHGLPFSLRLCNDPERRKVIEELLSEVLGGRSDSSANWRLRRRPRWPGAGQSRTSTRR